MNAEIAPLPGLLLMFVLGLRHGLDPDHIACIDGLTWRALSHKQRHAGWVGTLFAVGHGLLTLNLRLLLSRKEAYAPMGWKMSMIPRRLQAQSSAWAIVVIGVLFATVFDTATQAAAWGYVASNRDGGAWAALAAGLTFTAGMVITDTLDGRLVCRISRSAEGPEAGRKARRILGWLIVCISYAVAAYNLAKAWFPQVELSDIAFSWAGFSLVVVMLALWSWIARARSRSARSAGPAGGR